MTLSLTLLEFTCVNTLRNQYDKKTNSKELHTKSRPYRTNEHTQKQTRPRTIYTPYPIANLTSSLSALNSAPSLYSPFLRCFTTIFLALTTRCSTTASSKSSSKGLTSRTSITSCARVMLRERAASSGVSDQLSVTRSQVPAQRSVTSVSMARARLRVWVGIDGAERVCEVIDENGEGDGEGERRRRWKERGGGVPNSSEEKAEDDGRDREDEDEGVLRRRGRLPFSCLDRCRPRSISSSVSSSSLSSCSCSSPSAPSLSSLSSSLSLSPTLPILPLNNTALQVGQVPHAALPDPSHCSRHVSPNTHWHSE